MRKKIPIIVLFIIAGIFLINSVSATTCTVSSISKSMEEGSTIPTVPAFSCTNNGNSSTQINKVGNFFTLSESTPITLPANSTKQITLNFNSMAKGSYEGLIYADGLSVPITLNVTNPIDPNACQLNPSLVSYNQAVQQGTQFELPKIIFNPKNCDGDFSITSAYISGGITTSGGQKPVFIKSASSQEILLGVDTSGLSSAPYNSKLTVVAFSHTFTDISAINIVVTGGTNPDTNFDINNLPICSITSTTLNLNNTYSMVCTGVKPGVSVYPIIDTDYIKGIGPGDDSTSTNFVWNFQAKKYGNTIIKAEFRYLDLPVGDPFSQEVKISSSGHAVAGTALAFKFFPDLGTYTSEEPLIVQLIDNKTQSLVSQPRLWVNAKEINSTSESFEYTFEPEQDYELRGSAPGYDDIVQTITISPKPITIIISPSTGSTSTVFNITTNPPNSSLFIDDVKVDNPFYNTMTEGQHIIKAIM